MLVAQPDYDLEHFDATKIDASTSVLLKAGSSIPDVGFLLPLREHPGHLGSTQSYCVCLTLSDGRRLVVPCMELVRFYFGSSSTLLSRLFTPPLEKAHLFAEAPRFGGQHMTLNLAEGMPLASKEDVGRIAGNHVAWRAAAAISASCARATSIGRDAYPQTRFPFEGYTDIVAAGKWLSSEAGSRQTFLVYNLRSCTHPFPFTSLMARPWPRSDFGAGGSDQLAKARSMTYERKPSAPTLRERDGSKGLAPKDWGAHSNRQFPDLAHKRIWTSRTIPPPIANALTTPPVEDLAVGEPGSTARIRPVVLVEAVDSARVPLFLRDLVRALTLLSVTGVTLLTASSADGWTLTFDRADAKRVELGDRLESSLRVAAFLVEVLHQRRLLIACEGDDRAILIGPALGDEGPEAQLSAVQALLCQELESQPEPIETPDLVIDVADSTTVPALLAAWIKDHLHAPSTF